MPSAPKCASRWKLARSLAAAGGRSNTGADYAYSDAYMHTCRYEQVHAIIALLTMFPVLPVITHILPFSRTIRAEAFLLVLMSLRVYVATSGFDLVCLRTIATSTFPSCVKFSSLLPAHFFTTPCIISPTTSTNLTFRIIAPVLQLR